jgi:hypothetical protein
LPTIWYLWAPCHPKLMVLQQYRKPSRSWLLKMPRLLHWLWRVPWENGYKELFRRLAVNGGRAVGARCHRYFSAPCTCGVVGSGVHVDCERLRQHAFWSVRSLRLSALRCSAGWGELCFSSGTSGWLTRLLLSVRWCWLLSGQLQWSRVGNACGLWFVCLLA